MAFTTSWSKQKDGQVADVAAIIAFLFVLAIVAIFVVFLIKSWNTEIEKQNLPIVQNITQPASNNVPKYFDGSFALAIVILTSAIVISAYVLDTNPAFFVISIILLVLVIVIGALFGNIYSELQNQLDLTPTISSMPITNLIMNNLLLYAIILGGLVLITLYAKVRNR